MFECLFIVMMGISCGLGTFTIRMDGVQSNKLFPCSLLQLNPKNLLQKAPLLKSILNTVLSCNKRMVRPTYEIRNRKFKIDGHLPDRDIISQVLSEHILLVIWVTHPVVPMNEEVLALPIPI